MSERNRVPSEVGCPHGRIRLVIFEVAPKNILKIPSSSAYVKGGAKE